MNALMDAIDVLSDRLRAIQVSDDGIRRIKQSINRLLFEVQADAGRYCNSFEFIDDLEEDVDHTEETRNAVDLMSIHSVNGLYNAICGITECYADYCEGLQN